jgi:hypothetical protein
LTDDDRRWFLNAMTDDPGGRIKFTNSNCYKK